MKKKSQYKYSFSCFILLCSCLSCSSDSKEIVVEPGTGIQHDDFIYSVTDYAIHKSIVTLDDTLTTQGSYYVVRFKVMNKPKRVNHHWDNSIAYLIDENGNKYENSKALQQKINDKTSFGFQDAYTTVDGSSDSTILVFEIPPTVKKPYLMVRGETLMGDFLDGNRFRSTKIKLFQKHDS